MTLYIDRIPLALGTETVIPFRLDTARITLNYQLYEAGSGKQLIFMRFQTPSPGIWHIRVFSSDSMPGQFHIWLPIHGFVSDDTLFLRPNPNTTITDPGNVPMAVTAGAYNHTNGSIYIHSSRGFSSSGQIKPNLAAPGVSVQGPALTRPEGGREPVEPVLTRRTGTSAAAAITAGAAADILTWAIVDQNDETINSATIRSMLMRGADRNPAFTYPNREWGYGTLNLFRSFTSE